MLECIVETLQNGLFQLLVQCLKESMIYVIMIMNAKMTKCVGFQMKIIKLTILKLAWFCTVQKMEKVLDGKQHHQKCLLKMTLNKMVDFVKVVLHTLSQITKLNVQVFKT